MLGTERERWLALLVMLAMLAGVVEGEESEKMLPTPSKTLPTPSKTLPTPSKTLPTPSEMLPTHSSIVDDDNWGTLVAVTAVRGSTARLPCDVTSPTQDDPVLLVLWYRNASVTPVYSYDSRGVEGTAGATGGLRQQWGDEEAWGEEQRAWFNTSTTPAHLMVRAVGGRDEDSYMCTVHFRASPSWSQKITLTVQG
ncbi:uncharacterized protein [Cherax quadricarinatus]|uniref:uncharacterized protein n=1 Tax=Cherax quadricarinatus TaxID=27406 RepID=UPI00387EA918